MARPLNYDYHNYIIFYKEIFKSNPAKKRELTYKNSVFNIIKARSLNEALTLAREWAIYYGTDYIPYHGRRYNIDSMESIDTLRKRKNYLFFNE